ncbi:hypothetical protein BT93_G1291 [Corymbia citriodora subsp. variegata]|nr:hypothetical protein BT93_G1291 [Corymbia citriodora subsp. variegata]
MDKGPNRVNSVLGMDFGRSRSCSRAPGGRNPSHVRAIKGKNPAPPAAAGNCNLDNRREPSSSGFVKSGQPPILDSAATDHGQDSRTQRVGNPPQAARSWANVARAAMQGYSLSFFPPRLEGENVVHCTEEDLDAADPIWHQCLVGYFVGKKLPFRLVETALKHLWGQRLLEVKANDQGFYFFHIADPDFRRKVLEGGPVTVARVPLVLQQWQLMMELKKGEHSSIPVWIRLKNLPYDLWSATGISKIASAIGRPLYVDQRTKQLKMISFARVCIELSTSSPCHETIKVVVNDATRIVDVEYEWKPLSCPSCGIFGHRCTGTITRTPRTDTLERADVQTRLPADGTRLSSPPAPIADPLPGSAADTVLEDCRPKEDRIAGVLEDEWQTVSRRQQRPLTAVGLTAPLAVRPPAALLKQQNLQQLGNVQQASSSSQSQISSKQQFCSIQQQLDSNQQACSAILSSLPAPIRPSTSSPPAATVKSMQDNVVSPASRVVAAAFPSSPTSFGSIDDLDEDPTAILDQSMVMTQVDPILEDETPAMQLTEVRIEQVATSPVQSKSKKQTSGSRPSSGTLAAKTKTVARGRRPKRRIGLTLSVAYGEHTFVARRPLWNSIINLSLALKESPWMVAGDFNAIKDSSDRMGSPDIWISAFDEFKNCLDQVELFDLRYVGFRFTWSTSSGSRRKQRKIDRVLVNNHWCTVFSFSEASFLAPGISDHCPMVVRILDPIPRRIPFKFFNFWLTHPDFSMVVVQAWET